MTVELGTNLLITDGKLELLNAIARSLSWGHSSGFLGGSLASGFYMSLKCRPSPGVPSPLYHPSPPTLIPSIKVSFIPLSRELQTTLHEPSLLPGLSVSGNCSKVILYFKPVST